MFLSSVIDSCFAETMQLVLEYLSTFYESGKIVGGRIIATINKNSENPAFNHYQDNVYPPKTENDANNRLSCSNPVYTTFVCVIVIVKE